MNLFSLLNRGAAHAGMLARREIDNAAERAATAWAAGHPLPPGYGVPRKPRARRKPPHA